MTELLPIVGVSTCSRSDSGMPFHRVANKYVRAIPEASKCAPVLIPALGQDTHLASLVDRLDGLMLTGSPSNVEPHHYGGPDSVEGTEHDPVRDETTLPLFRACLEAGVPVLGVCRGIQEMNAALGGTLHQRIFDMPEMMDHRMRRDVEYDQKYRPAHSIRVREGGLLHNILGETEILVNSLHAQSIDTPGQGVVVEATAPDGIIEAVSIPGAKAFALGVQWHPEHPWPLSTHSRAIFAAFGEACRARAASRLGLATAAE